MTVARVLVRCPRSNTILSGTPDVSHEQTFLQQLPLIDRLTASVCSRNHLAATDADDFASTVMRKLIKDDYALLRKFDGRSSLRTYLHTVIQRLFLDYQTSVWPHWRPSAEAKRGGSVAVLLEQMLKRDGYTFDEACELIWTKHGVTTDRARLEEIAAALPDRAKRRFEGDVTVVDLPATTPPTDEGVELTPRVGQRPRDDR